MMDKISKTIRLTDVKPPAGPSFVGQIAQFVGVKCGIYMYIHLFIWKGNQPEERSDDLRHNMNILTRIPCGTQEHEILANSIAETPDSIPTYVFHNCYALVKHDRERPTHW
jgi:hypothetical protein